jgi:FPC/CPF motif-containing protein YcgG
MAEALQNIGNLWDHLSDLHQKDPEKYKEVIEDSAKGGVALNTFSAKVRIRRS